MKQEETIISKLVVKEQSEFEEWILKNTALGYSALRGWRDEFGIVDYEDIDIKNKWSGWLAAKTGFKSCERNVLNKYIVQMNYICYNASIIN